MLSAASFFQRSLQNIVTKPPSFVCVINTRSVHIFFGTLYIQEYFHISRRHAYLLLAHCSSVLAHRVEEQCTVQQT
jgi:hypothetical protein